MRQLVTSRHCEACSAESPVPVRVGTAVRDMCTHLLRSSTSSAALGSCCVGRSHLLSELRILSVLHLISGRSGRSQSSPYQSSFVSLAPRFREARMTLMRG